MKQVMKFGIVFWSDVAFRETLRAANAKDYLLRRKVDRRFKEIANQLVLGRGYIIATDVELEKMYPQLYKASGVCESKKMIWAIQFNRLGRCGKMRFVPVR